MSVSACWAMPTDRPSSIQNAAPMNCVRRYSEASASRPRPVAVRATVVVRADRIGSARRRAATAAIGGEGGECERGAKILVPPAPAGPQRGEFPALPPHPPTTFSGGGGGWPFPPRPPGGE